MLLGTYQGEGYPLDEDLNYDENVDKVVNEKFAKYYDESGNIVPDYMAKYIELETDGIKARYRIREWAENNPLSMIKSYLIEKPLYMIKSVFYWQEIFNVPKTRIVLFRNLNLTLCCIIILISIFIKKYRSIILFLSSIYIINIYVYAMIFAFDRYAATLTPLRFIIVGIGFSIMYKLLLNIIKRVKM